MKFFVAFLCCILIFGKIHEVTSDAWPGTLCCLLFCDVCCANPFCIGGRKKRFSVFGGLIKHHKTCENTQCGLGETCFDECDDKNVCRPVCKIFTGP
uniref:Uncharacterized protein n=1 Tax=Panagrolaimus sp. ES5 TaxID=591445 RepID=A0AC34FGH3_9BILA